MVKPPGFARGQRGFDSRRTLARQGVSIAAPWDLHGLIVSALASLSVRWAYSAIPVLCVSLSTKVFVCPSDLRRHGETD